MDGKGLEASLAKVALEDIDGICHELRNLKKRWNNRIVLERSSLAELYLNGRIEILIYGDWNIAGKEYLWVCCISANATVDVSAETTSCVEIIDRRDGDCRQHEIVLVIVVEGMEAPQRFIRSAVRPYLIEKKLRSTGEGLLYRREIRFPGYEIFPVFPHRKMDLGIWLTRGKQAHNAGGKMIECSPEIMDNISDNDGERLWDWLFGSVGQIRDGRLALNRYTAHFLDGDLIEVPVQGRRTPYQLINVAVGPLNL